MFRPLCPPTTRLGRAYCCACWFVLDEEESERRACWGLRLRVLSADPARPVRTRLAWAVHRWLDRRCGPDGLGGCLPWRDESETAGL